MRVVFATAWFALLTAGTVVLFGAEPVSASTTTNFGGQASPVHLRESSGAVDKAHNGMNIVSNTEDLKELIAQTANKPFDEIQRDIEKVFEDLLEELKEQFPPHDQAPNHAERRGNVSLVVRKAEEAFIKLGVQYGMPEKQLRKHLDPIMKHVEDIVVIIGRSTPYAHTIRYDLTFYRGLGGTTPSLVQDFDYFRHHAHHPRVVVVEQGVVWRS
ncbi:uncharacterized protein B0H18DRAFT_952623 [Fomitopsis serialis]|uniref:uncharacterized protein n=1 Tax=Fomitopsis serialis TaxID=139415 RepID=UPI002007C8C8|nr:uncharacterized protein B0H18DRAFT_952623 [Neoantrodia serialis]KAH9931403.1 hypothetical protein B0H18DRAFT_952623 [Neoantrodia serialis]